MSLPNKPTLPNWFAKMEMLANALFPSCCPVLEALCAHLEDAALVNLTKSASRRAVASAIREMARRPVFALLQDISRNGWWKDGQQMYSVCKAGSAWGVQQMIQNGANDWNRWLWYACLGGHRDVVELMIQHGANNWNLGLHGACRGGHRDLTELMIQRGANNLNWGLYGACVRGHRELAEIMIQHGATACSNNDCPGHASLQ